MMPANVPGFASPTVNVLAPSETVPPEPEKLPTVTLLSRLKVPLLTTSLIDDVNALVELATRVPF